MEKLLGICDNNIAMTSQDTLRGQPKETHPCFSDELVRKSMQAEVGRASDLTDRSNHVQRQRSQSAGACIPKKTAKEGLNRAGNSSINLSSSTLRTAEPKKKSWRGSPRRLLERVKPRRSWGTTNSHTVFSGGSPSPTTSMDGVRPGP